MKLNAVQWVFLASVFLAMSSADAATPPPINVKFINKAEDVTGFWDDSIRADFVEAMNLVANNVSAAWRNGQPVTIGSKGGMRLIVVDHPLYIGKSQVGGYHSTGSTGPYAIIDLTVALQQEGPGGPYLFGSHEVAEMLVDPSVNRFAHGVFMEVADPVVCCHYDLTLSDASVVPVSDFVLPTWFTPNSIGPYDFVASPYIQAPFQLGPGGY